MATKPASQGAALTAALDEISYEFLATNYPALVSAIDKELRNGLHPEGVRFAVQRHVGPEREGIAQRCEQAARHIASRLHVEE